MEKFVVFSGTVIYQNPVVEAARRAAETGNPHPSDAKTFDRHVKAAMEASEGRYRKPQNGDGSR
ncbi:MAG: hypothetical protein JEZ06_23310 [Anaerolineaceae bacterium]|nr:hypothetical protein [Anaerolineaceae bacterium]